MANWTQALISGAGLWDQMDRYDELGKGIGQGIDELSEQVAGNTEFQPFSATGYGGNAQATADGVQFNLNADQQASADALAGYSDQFFASAAGDQGMREQNIYDAIRAMQQPGENRAMTDMEARLQAQGRLNMGSSQYGSSPEMFGLNMANAEARNSAAYAAMEQARAQQMQDANIGTTFQQNQYLPQAQLQNMFNPALQNAQLQQGTQLANANLQAQLGLGGLQTQTNAEKIRADMIGQAYGTAAGMFSSNNYDPVGDAAGGLWDAIKGWF